jgi:hypothetical protein
MPRNNRPFRFVHATTLPEVFTRDYAVDTPMPQAPSEADAARREAQEVEDAHMRAYQEYLERMRNNNNGEDT